MSGRPYHLRISIHARVVRGEQVFADVFEIDAPGISGLLQKAFDFDLDAASLLDVAAMLQVLDLLLEIRTAAALGCEPALGNLIMRHARFVEWIQESAVAAAVALRIS